MPVNINIHNLKDMHGDKAEHVFREIADIGGFGAVGDSESAISLNYPGGLDVQGVLDPSNTVISEKSKDRIAELAGVDRNAVESREFESSAGKMKNKKGE